MTPGDTSWQERIEIARPRTAPELAKTFPNRRTPYAETCAAIASGKNFSTPQKHAEATLRRY